MATDSVTMESLQAQITELMLQLEKTKSESDTAERKLQNKFKELSDTCITKILDVLDASVREMSDITTDCFHKALPQQSDEQKKILEECIEEIESRAASCKDRMKDDIIGFGKYDIPIETEEKIKLLHLRKGPKVAADPKKTKKPTKKIPSIILPTDPTSQELTIMRNQPSSPPRQLTEPLFPPHQENRSQSPPIEHHDNEGHLFLSPTRRGTSPSTDSAVMDASASNIQSADANNEEDPDQTPFTSVTRRPKKEKTTPIIVKDDRYTWAQLKEMIKAIGQEGFSGKLIVDGFNIKSKSQDQQRAITAMLNEKEITYHSFTLPDDKFIKVVIRGLPITTKVEDIQSDLLAAGFVVRQVAQLTRRRDGDKVPMPLFLITLSQTERHEQIHQQKFILDLQVKIEEYRGREGPSQCHKCQEFGHTQRNCGRPPRCVKCTADDHMTADCPKEKEDLPQCCNCKGQHTANWTGCPLYPKDIPSKKPPTGNIPTRQARLFTNTNISYAQAITGLPPQQVQTSTMPPPPAQTIPDIHLQSALDTTNELKQLINWLKDNEIIELLQTLKTSLSTKKPPGTQQPDNV